MFGTRKRVIALKRTQNIARSYQYFTLNGITQPVLLWDNNGLIKAKILRETPLKPHKSIRLRGFSHYLPIN